MDTYKNKEKIYLNGIPVYRDELEDGTARYLLFEDTLNGHVIFMATGTPRLVEYQNIVEAITNLMYPKNLEDKDFKIAIRVEEYEQSKRDKQWLQKPLKKHTRVVLHERSGDIPGEKGDM